MHVHKCTSRIRTYWPPPGSGANTYAHCMYTCTSMCCMHLRWLAAMQHNGTTCACSTCNTACAQVLQVHICRRNARTSRVHIMPASFVGRHTCARNVHTSRPHVHVQNVHTHVLHTTVRPTPHRGGWTYSPPPKEE